MDKSPGLRPIGIGEVLRRRRSKSIIYVVKQDMQEAAGGLQLCVSQTSGSEARLHAIQELFMEEDTHGIIQVDTNNAFFNSINRNMFLHNIKVLFV